MLRTQSPHRDPSLILEGNGVIVDDADGAGTHFKDSCSMGSEITPIVAFDLVILLLKFVGAVLGWMLS